MGSAISNWQAETAAKAAQLSRYRVVTYERPRGLLEQLLPLEAETPDHVLSAESVNSALDAAAVVPHAELRTGNSSCDAAQTVVSLPSAASTLLAQLCSDTTVAAIRGDEGVTSTGSANVGHAE